MALLLRFSMRLGRCPWKVISSTGTLAAGPRLEEYLLKPLRISHPAPMIYKHLSLLLECEPDLPVALYYFPHRTNHLLSKLSPMFCPIFANKLFSSSAVLLLSTAFRSLIKSIFSVCLVFPGTTLFRFLQNVCGLP